MRIWLGIILLGLLGLGPGTAAAGPPGMKLLVSPPSLIFRVSMPQTVAVAEVSVQVLSPGPRPWRLTVTALGPMQAGDGSVIPISQVTWRGSPGGVFLAGILKTGQPQLLGRGHGSKAGIVRFFLKNSWDLAEGQYNQRLIFQLSSP